MSLTETGSLLALVDDRVVERAKFAHETNESFAERVLRARSNNVDKAAELAVQIAEWRDLRHPGVIAQTHPDELLDISEEELSSMYPHTYLPVTDVEGRPVYWEKTGQIDVDALMASTTLDKVLMWHIHTIEAVCVPMMAASQGATGRNVNQVTNILDCKGLTLSSLNAQTREYLRLISEMDKSYYPELLGTMLILNAPTAFYAIWSFVSAFLDPRTRQKIVVCRDGGLDEWVRIMGSLDRVPIEYGGTLVIHEQAMRGAMEKTQVSSGQVVTVSETVEVDANIIVRSLVRSSPIRVLVAVSRSDEHVRVVMDERWTDCDKVVKELEVELKQGETISVSWDNSSNWISRDVMYSIMPKKTRLQRTAEYRDKLRRYGIEWIQATSESVEE